MTHDVTLLACKPTGFGGYEGNPVDAYYPDCIAILQKNAHLYFQLPNFRKIYVSITYSEEPVSKQKQRTPAPEKEATTL